jgi:hypothetical protein
MVRIPSWLSAAVLVAVMVLPARAEKKAKEPPPPSVTDPAQAGPDFAVQGEYAGTVDSDGNQVKFGVQIVALGEGKFHGVAYGGGLPGDGWDGKTREQGDGQTKDGTTTFAGKEGTSGTLKDGVLKISNGDGRTIGTFKKVCRKSPTLGAKPPAEALVLFDGTTADHFTGGRMTKDGLLMEGATSKEKFRDYTIHLEFLIPFEPSRRGQGRGNSGYYAQSRYETQILDSFGLESKNNECGAIYGVRAPEMIMSYPPLSWQTYDVDFTAAVYKDGKKVKNARLTVRHNGVQILTDCEAPHATTASPLPEGPEPAGFYLQNHGNPVRFRNIWVVEKK